MEEGSVEEYIEAITAVEAEGDNNNPVADDMKKKKKVVVVVVVTVVNYYSPNTSVN